MRVTTWGLQARRDSVLNKLARGPRRGSTGP